MRTRQLCLFLGLAALLVAGCSEAGPSLALVEGTVTYNGTAVSGAAVTMIFDGGHTATGTTGSDGKFTMGTGGRPGAPIGSAKVIITKLTGGSAAAPSSGAMKPEDMMKMQTQGSGVTVSKNELPEKYSNPSSSGLTADVVAGGKEKNTFTFPLTD